MSSNVGSTECRVLVSSGNIKKAYKFFKDIDPNDSANKLPKLAKRKYEDQQVVTGIQSGGRQIIQNLVYDVYEPLRYKRTYKALNSVLATSGLDKSNIDGSLALYSDPTIATAEETTDILSYLAFFERPEEFKTFIHPREIASRPRNYRPFFETWIKFMKRFNEQWSREVMLSSISDLLPDMSA